MKIDEDFKKCFVSCAIECKNVKTKYHLDYTLQALYTALVTGSRKRYGFVYTPQTKKMVF